MDKYNYTIKMYKWMNNVSKSTCTRLFLAFVYSYYEKGEECTATHERIAEMLNCSSRTITRVVKELTDKGIIEVDRKHADAISTYRFVGKEVTL